MVLIQTMMTVAPRSRDDRLGQEIGFMQWLPSCIAAGWFVMMLGVAGALNG
jgi:hypothetical protein